jgi:tetratricopeptide (TPR) repeat protein
MVNALPYHCGGNLEEAGKEFDKALAFDRQSTISRGWYTYYLFTVGRQEEALRQITLNREERIDNSYAHALSGIYLCRVGRFEDAERAFTQAIALDRNYWLTHYGMTLLYLSTGKREQAEPQAKRLEALTEPDEYERLIRQINLSAKRE